MTTAELIVKARKRKKWEPVDLAREMGVARSVVSRWEKGAVPTPRNMYKLADILDVNVVQLIGTRFQEPPKQRKKVA